MADKQYREEYVINGISAERLEQTVAEIWNDLRSDPQLREEVEAEGIDLHQLNEYESRTAIAIETQGSGFAATTILVSFTPVVAKIVSDVWKTVILPRIRNKWGEDSIKKK